MPVKSLHFNWALLLSIMADGRADKDSYPHDGRADNAPYRHDRRADKNPYRHDRNIRFSSKLNYALFCIFMVSFI